jgi:hypothetical protein
MTCLIVGVATMRLPWLFALASLVTGCANGFAERQAELAKWVGRPETELVGMMGAPARTYETGGMKFLTYEEQRIEIAPGAPYYFGSGPFGYAGGLPPTARTLVCETTFTIADGVVRAFSLRGTACG